jgi:hypothetical protein
MERWEVSLLSSVFYTPTRFVFPKFSESFFLTPAYSPLPVVLFFPVCQSHVTERKKCTRYSIVNLGIP